MFSFFYFFLFLYEGWLHNWKKYRKRILYRNIERDKGFKENLIWILFILFIYNNYFVYIYFYILLLSGLSKSVLVCKRSLQYSDYLWISTCFIYVSLYVLRHFYSLSCKILIKLLLIQCGIIKNNWDKIKTKKKIKKLNELNSVKHCDGINERSIFKWILFYYIFPSIKQLHGSTCL